MDPLRYFVSHESDPDKPGYGVVIGLRRFDPAWPEYYDRDRNEWVFWADLSFMGFGGGSDHIEVTEEFANECVAAWQRGEDAPNVLETLPANG